MAQRHVNQLFSAAYDDTLTPRHAADFAAHIRECGGCATEYERFRTSVEALRAMPKAQMPQRVHLPVTRPIAERRRVWRSVKTRRPQLWFGGATAVGVAAAAVVVALSGLHLGAMDNGVASRSPALRVPQAATSTGSGCTPTLASGASQAAPAGFFQDSRSDPRRPGQTLTLATSTQQASRGSEVIVYARLSAPAPAAAAPGGDGAAGPVESITPCISVSPSTAGLSHHGVAPQPNDAGAEPNRVSTTPLYGAAISSRSAPGASPLIEFTVPTDAAVGSVLHVIATIPAGFPNAGDPAMAVELQVVVR